MELFGESAGAEPEPASDWDPVAEEAVALLSPYPSSSSLAPAHREEQVAEAALAQREAGSALARIALLRDPRQPPLLRTP